MKFTLTIFIGLGLLVAAECHPLGQKEAYEQLMKLLGTPIKPERYSYENYAFSKGYSSYKVTSFNWRSCDTSAPVQATVTLTPDPLVVPGNVTVAFNASVGVDIESKVKLELTVKKKVVVWIDVPCIDNVGSCTYDDVCTLISAGTPCPDPLPKYNIPCHCPLTKGDYILPASEFEIPSSNLPGISGDYQVSAKLSHNGQQLACFDIDASVA
ncbi:ganglioside GM2 activator-like [Anneissia japonica]|uniref:ganglioside GM2 activator-like n=1 Tax=Anneissia japonica TaxID=1529436 RepID=UPI00142574B7|nr:ganglioside GM2 activator-like [Anneissia japonica]